MSVKSFCESQKTLAVSDELNGIAIKSIEYGIVDRVYCISGFFLENEKLRGYHNVRIHYEFKLEDEAKPYIKLLRNGEYHKIYLDSFIRTNTEYGYF